MKCEFASDSMVRNGKLIPCKRNAKVKMRLRGLDAILMGKKNVCTKHMDLLLSPETKAAGRDWQVDRFLDKGKKK